MGFYPQPNSWSCGPFALKHALAVLGKVASDEAIVRQTRPHWWHGTDEVRLARAARAFDCQLQTLRASSSQEARALLKRHLQRKTPVILCVDNWGHWVTVVHYEGRDFVVVDSNKDPVLRVLPWAKLEKRWRYHLPGPDSEPSPVYDMHPVVPNFRAHARAGFSIERVRYLSKAKNRTLSHNWSAYLEDLLEVCGYPAVVSNERVTLAELLRRNRRQIISRVLYWHGDVSRDLLERLLDDYRFVAETYGLSVALSQVRRAVTDLSILTTLWATARRGISPMYGCGEA